MTDESDDSEWGPMFFPGDVVRVNNKTLKASYKGMVGTVIKQERPTNVVVEFREPEGMHEFRGRHGFMPESLDFVVTDDEVQTAIESIQRRETP